MYLKKWPQVKNRVLFLRSVGVKKSNHLIRIIDNFEQGQIFCRNGIAHHLMQLLNQRLPILCVIQHHGTLFYFPSLYQGKNFKEFIQRSYAPRGNEESRAIVDKDDFACKKIFKINQMIHKGIMEHVSKGK